MTHPTPSPHPAGVWREPPCVFCLRPIQPTSEAPGPEFLHSRGCWACPPCSRTRTRDTEAPVLWTA